MYIKVFARPFHGAFGYSTLICFVEYLLTEYWSVCKYLAQYRPRLLKRLSTPALTAVGKSA